MTKTKKPLQSHPFSSSLLIKKTTMQNTHLLLLLLLFLSMLTTTNPSLTSPSSPSSSSFPMQEMNNIVDALIGAGDTNINQWVNIFSMANPSMSLTLFIPQQDTTKNNSNPSPVFDPFLFPYHVVPQRLTFSDLLLFPCNARLPTLLPGKSIAVTDNSVANFSLDDVKLTHPDLYSTSSLAVHGVETLLDYSLFGESLPPSPTFLPIASNACLCSMSFFVFFLLFSLMW